MNLRLKFYGKIGIIILSMIIFNLGNVVIGQESSIKIESIHPKCRAIRIEDEVIWRDTCSIVPEVGSVCGNRSCESIEICKHPIEFYNPFSGEYKKICEDPDPYSFGRADAGSETVYDRVVPKHEALRISLRHKNLSNLQLIYDYSCEISGHQNHAVIEMTTMFRRVIYHCPCGYKTKTGTGDYFGSAACNSIPGGDRKEK